MHKAIIATIGNFKPIKNKDRIISADVITSNVIAEVIVSTDHTEGDIGVYFEPDLQINRDYCERNDLIARFGEDGKKIGGGYLSDNCRITAQRFGGVKSNGLWMPLESLQTTTKFQVGDMFDTLDGKEFCKKYVNPHVKIAVPSPRTKQKKNKREIVCFPRHPDTEQLVYFISTIPAGAQITITRKYHGTSHRVGNVPVKQNLNWFKRGINYIARKEVFPTTRYEIVHGTRRTIMEDGKQGYYGNDEFRLRAAYKPLPEDLILYGEIVGWVDSNRLIMPAHTNTLPQFEKDLGKEVQYTYGLEKGNCKFIVYRAAVVAGNDVVDYTFTTTQKIAQAYGYECVDLLDEFVYDGDADALLARVKKIAEPNGWYAKNQWHLDEGVVVRIEGQNPTHYKYKNMVFKILEGIVKEVDPEDMI